MASSYVKRLKGVLSFVRCSVLIGRDSASFIMLMKSSSIVFSSFSKFPSNSSSKRENSTRCLLSTLDSALKLGPKVYIFPPRKGTSASRYSWAVCVRNACLLKYCSSSRVSIISQLPEADTTCGTTISRYSTRS